MTREGGYQAWWRLVHLVGILLTLAAISLVVYRIATADFTELEGVAVTRSILVTVAAAVLYGSSGFLLAWAWFQLLSSFAARRLPRCWIIATQAITQVFKYLPSNVIHLVGRHVSVRRLGVEHSVLVAAAIVEVIGLVVAAVVLAVVTGSAMLAEHGPELGINLNNPRLVTAVVVLLALCILLIWALANKRVKVRLPRISTMVVVFVLYTVFFINAALVLGLLSRFGLSLTLSSADLIAVATTAWIAGYVVPGAPAGIGVREAVLILLLQPTIGPTSAVALAGLYRLSTFSGDLLLALMGTALRQISCERSVVNGRTPEPDLEKNADKGARRGGMS